jgi:hypothetical protein
MNRIWRHLSYANVVATLALLFAMSGGALAAKHYLINSTKQINPKVLKRLKGNTGRTGRQGQAGAQGLVGAQGPGGPQGPLGKEGPRGPSEVYEVEIAKSHGPSQNHTLTLSKLPPGTYVIFGRAGLIPNERKSSGARCDLATVGGVDSDFFTFISPGTGFEVAPMTMQLTVTLESTADVTMRCGFEAALPSFLSTNPTARIVAIRVDSQHKTTAEGS